MSTKLYELKGLKIEGYRGTWYNVTEGRKFIINGKEEEIFIWEHEKYGGDTAHIIANAEGTPFMTNVWNWWDDWKEYVLDEQGFCHRDFNIKLDELFEV